MNTAAEYCQEDFCGEKGSQPMKLAATLRCTFWQCQLTSASKCRLASLSRTTSNCNENKISTQQHEFSGTAVRGLWHSRMRFLVSLNWHYLQLQCKRTRKHTGTHEGKGSVRSECPR